MKKQEKTPEKQLNEVEIGNLPEKRIQNNDREIRQEKEIKGIQIRREEVNLSVCRCYYLICRKP